MPADHADKEASARQQFEKAVGKKESRHLRARRRGDRGVWFGLGMFGLVGWSVVIPTLLGLALGLWIDATWPSSYSWTLMCLVLGVGLGCYNAWHWIGQESRLIDEEEQEPPVGEQNGRN